ncbi:PBSX family phage terminase large subunit [Clostridioides sp. ES-W-0016-02]|uniref:PBSX family phage terminase large subunit n=1 Tax=Clostridioides sp. ES-W-0016-02 TaxID=2770788 RepID=UPI001D1058A4|nr:PBSX family phage terminase large subunit [Clostridioides sp. ES-W-0016-02]
MSNISRIEALKNKINILKNSKISNIKKATIKFSPFSKKQKKIFTWWLPNSPVKHLDGIIADGAIRSGKTVSMSLSYVIWAMESFNSQNFGMCGKTIGSFRRNVLFWLKLMLIARKYKVKDHRADNLLIVTKGNITNYFYIFGGKDERSQDLIQGITLAGCFFDEVALMPQSFVNQATGRCSVDNSKFWFNCNPDGPYHWFKIEWIDKKEDKNILYLHFTMDDNLSLSEKIKERYRSMYSGVFYDRYIKGEWKNADGVIYSMFDDKKHVVKASSYKYIEYHVSCDYGTHNPATFQLWGKTRENKHILIKQYFYDGRKEGIQKTDKEYSEDMKEFIKDYRVKTIIVDPSASSFITQLRKDGFKVIKARNDVLDGIRLSASLLTQMRVLFDESCIDLFQEFSAYIWDLEASKKGEDKPIKEHDHCMDAFRYYCFTIVKNKIVKPSMTRG